MDGPGHAGCCGIDSCMNNEFVTVFVCAGEETNVGPSLEAKGGCSSHCIQVCQSTFGIISTEETCSE